MTTLPILLENMVLASGSVIADGATSAADPTLSWWWETVQKIGAGATFVMGVVLVFLWRAYQAKDAQITTVTKEKDAQLAVEVAYSRDRDKQTLVVMSELMTLIRGIDERDKKAADSSLTSTSEILKAITELKGIVREHFIASRNQTANSNAA